MQRVQALADISRSALRCHSSETRAPIANPPNSAQSTKKVPVITLFMIIVAPFYLFYISSYYLVSSLYRYSIVLAIFVSVLVL